MPTADELFAALDAYARDLPGQLNAYNAARISELAVAYAANETLKTQITALKADNAELQKRIDDLTRPRGRVPLIDHRQIRDVAMLLITLDAAPSANKDSIGYGLIKLARDVGFNAVRFLRNDVEIADDLQRDSANPRNLPFWCKLNGVLWIADTIDLMAARLNDAQLAVYLENVRKAGAVALTINDADRNDLAASLPTIVKRIRAASDLPLIASLTANANLSYYESLVDIVEIQTFGTLDEFKRFVESPADVLCLDGQRSASISYVQAMLMTVLDHKRNSFSVYAGYDRKTNWREMGDMVNVYRAFLTAWNKQVN